MRFIRLDFSQIMGIPHARLFKWDGTVVPYKGNYFMAYPIVTMMLRNFLALELFREYGESSQFPYMDFLGKYYYCDFAFYLLNFAYLKP